MTTDNREEKKQERIENEKIGATHLSIIINRKSPIYRYNM